MKKILSAIFFFLLFSPIVSGQDYPDFGIPSQEDIALKDCPFEKGAASVMLIHEAFSYSEDGIGLTTTHHIRIKVLNQSGVKAADISIPFLRGNYLERISDVEAVTINISNDGTITKQKVEKQTIYSSKITEQLGEINFAFPSVKVGSIIEYQYKSSLKNYWDIQDWYFQDNMPVMISRYHLIMTPNNKFSYRIKKIPGLEVNVLEEPTRIFFEMLNVPALTDEPYMDARVDNIQCVSFEVNNYSSRFRSTGNSMLFLSWSLLHRVIMNRSDFWPQLTENIKGTADFVSQTKLLSSPEERMTAVYNYVRKNMLWNHTNSKTSADGVKLAWKNHEGTTGDINLILINLLKKVNLSAYPILVSERFHGKVDTAYPHLEQFNAVYAIVVVGKKYFYLNAASKYTPAGITPVSILNTLAFMVTDNASGLIKISNDSTRYNEGIYLDTKLSEDGKLNGSALIKSTGYARIEKKKAFENNKDELKESLTESKSVPVTITNFEIKNIDNDSLSLDQTFNFSINLPGTADYKFISTHLFSGFDRNPFVNDIRFSNINLGFNKVILLNSSIELPANYSLNEIPEPVDLETPEKDIQFSRKITFNKENNTVYINTKIEFNKSYYNAEFYPILKEFYKKMFNVLNEELALKKK